MPPLLRTLLRTLVIIKLCDIKEQDGGIKERARFLIQGTLVVIKMAATVPAITSTFR